MREALKAINELKRKKLIEDYAVGGGIAALFYIEPFLTYDLDVFISVPLQKEGSRIISLSPLYDYLEKKGCSWKGEHILAGGVPVQFIPADKLEVEAIANAKSVEYDGIKTKVFTPEYLIAILLRVGRKKDFYKIDMLTRQADINRKTLDDILKRYNLAETFRRLK